MRICLKMIIRSLSLLLFLVNLQPYAEAQGLENLADSSSELFVKNRLSAQLVTGALLGPVSWLNGHATFDYAQTNLRLGWMASEPTEIKYFGRGNFELLFEFTNSIIFQGFGSYLRGFTLLGRYNLLLESSKWVPYIQAGAGVVVNDVYEDMMQQEIGQAVEFTLQTSVGLRYLMARKWTLDVEAMYHHVSNAGLASRNEGINAVGGFMGATYFFDKLWH